jgi:hypothetical protein
MGTGVLLSLVGSKMGMDGMDSRGSRHGSMGRDMATAELYRLRTD